MENFSNKEIIQKYNISEPTLFKWLKNAQTNKNNLIVQKVGKTYKIIKNEQNISELERLYLEAQKFKNKTALEKIVPKPEFFEIFSHRQIIEIINDLQSNKEINCKFNYFRNGAKLWDKIAAKNSDYKTKPRNIQILLNSIPFLLKKINKFNQINIIDIGCGNGLASLEFVKYFQDKKLLNKYIAIDISPQMIEIARQNLTEEIQNLNFQSYIHDIEDTDVKEICFDKKDNKMVNLVLFFGDTIGNFNNENRVWSNLKGSLAKDDILIITNKLDKNNNKTDFSAQKKHFEILLNLPKMLNLVEENPKLNFIFNEKKQARCAYLELSKDYILTIKNDQIDTVLKFQKGDMIEIWMHRLSTIQSLLDNLTAHQMEMIQMTTEKDGNHALIIAEKK